ncbi:MAG: MBL fold metallo-hydrolase [Acidobacteriota bacterium]
MNLNEPYTELTENIFVLHEKMFPLYLIRGEKNFLIDTSISAYGESIGDKLKEILGEEKVHNILLTHSHYDHTGALPYLQNKSGCQIAGSGRTIELLEKPEVRDFIADMNTGFNKVLGSEKIEKFPELKDLVSLREGDRIKIDEKRYFEIIDTPGHTKCSISFLLMPEKILFPGDAAGVTERNGKNKPLFLSDYSSYVLSLKKLLKVEAEMLCPPHNKYIIGKERVREHLEKSLKSAIILKEKIEKALESGEGIEEVSETILEKEFPQPTVQGPAKAFNINLLSMVHAVFKIFQEK